MDWYVADKKYVAYLRRFDDKVGKVEYGKRLKLHIGILFKIDGFNYYVPLSSPKHKHNTMKNGLDFHKIIDPETGELYAVININNMIPIPDKYITILKYNNIEKYRSFENEKEKTDYIYLLQKEKAIIDSLTDTLQEKAIKLYSKCKNKPESSLAKRCCRFTLLQEKLLEYTG